MNITRAYKYRIYPAVEQRQLLTNIFGCVRKTYNYFLDQRITQYNQYKSDNGSVKEWLNYYSQAKQLKPMKTKGCEWLRIAPSQAYQHALKNLQSAFDKFLKHTAKYPKFKKLRDRNSFTVSQQAKIENGKVYLAKVGYIKTKISKQIPRTARVLSSTFSYNGNPKHKNTQYYVSFTVTEEYHTTYMKTNKAVGIDLGLIDKLVCSDGLRFTSNKYYKKWDKKLKTAQRHLSRKSRVNKKLGITESHRYENQVAKVRRLYTRIVSCRTDYNHKISTYLVHNYDIICAEKLTVGNMQKNHRLARAIANEGWHDLCRMLKYKCEWNGKQFVQVNPKNTSKQCNGCGSVLGGKLSLSVRRWVCPNCGAENDRDLNASRNILDSGLEKLSSQGACDYIRGVGVRQPMAATDREANKFQCNKTLNPIGL